MTRPWAAMGALILALSAGPALAGGYWDAGGPEPGDDAPASYHHDGDCDRPCPPCPDAREHGWRDGWSDRDDRDHEGWRREGWREHRGEAHEVFLPAEFFEGGGGVGPDVFIEDSGGAGGFVDDGSFAGAGASAFASASASARVSIHEREFMHHKMMHQMMHPMMMHPMMKHGGHGHW
jgi:hypothetical protein